MAQRMKEVVERKGESNVLTIVVEQKGGRWLPRSGGGTHRDKRDRRENRRTKAKRAIGEFT